MVNRRIELRGLVLVALLFGSGLLHAQPACNPATPCITSLQSGLPGPSGPTAPTNGAAITAGTPGGNYDESGTGIFLYINGNFAADSNLEGVTWTESAVPTTLNVVSQSDTQVVAFVPQNLFASAGSASIVVSETFDYILTELHPRGDAPISTLSNSVTFTVNPALASVGALPAGVVGVPYSKPFFTGGTTSFSLGEGFTAPGGLSYTPGVTNLLSGTPTTPGLAQPVTAFITDSWGNSLNVSDTININTLPVITTASLPVDVVNVPYQTVTLTAQNGTGPYSWMVTGLPTGLALTMGNTIAGTPTVSGPFTAVVTVTDSNGNMAQESFSSIIYGILTITTSALPVGKINTPYTSTTLTKSGGVAAYHWSATGLPAGLTLSQAGVLSGTPTVSGNFLANITLTDGSGQTATASLPLTIAGNLTITTAGLPPGTVGSGYTATLSGSGGFPPYSWAATGLPSGLGINSAGVISGTPGQTGSSTVSVTLTDSSAQTARATFGITINPAPVPPVQITTGSLPNGTVGVSYASLIGVTGGNGGPYTFSVAGSLPPGMTVANNGQLQGTPTTPGNFSFSVTATDSNGNSGSGTVSITIVAAPLLITNGALSTIQAGSSFGVTFTATGGVPPYTFALSGSAPPGASFSGATLGGTVTTAGSYSFTVKVTDSVKTTSSKSFTLLVTPAPLTISASLPAGTAGVAYSGQLSATGGTPPYTYTGSAGGGLTVASSGSVSGTPTTAGTYSVSATVTDSLGVTASGTFSVTINPSGLKVTTSSLPNGSLTTPYSASLGATGGTPPYSWSVGGLPSGISASSTGALSGTPTSPGSFTVSVTVKDSMGVSASANLALTILAAPLKITTTSISPITLGASFSVGFGATGGTPPYTWTATGLPAGVTISSTGTLSGTPTAVGTSSITVNVADVNGLTASETVSLTVALPSAPNLTFTGLPATVSPATQSTSTVTFSVSYPVAVTVNLTLTFTPLSGADDPNIQFSTGGRTATVTIPAGATASTSSIGVQTGTVAGTITITAQLVAAGQDITPTPPPTKTIVIAPAAPSITSVTATTSSTGFTVTLDGFDTTRAVTQVIFTFTPVAGANLQTTSVTIPATSLFSAWYQSTASAAYGSQFSFAIPFTVTGNVQSIASVTVTLVNPTGTSTSMTATL